MTVAAGRSNLQLRVVSGVILAIAVLVLTWAGGFWYRLLCAIIGGAIFYEWTGMLMPKARATHRIVLAALFAPILLLLLAGWPMVMILVASGLIFVISAAFSLSTGNGLWPALGVLYAGVSAIALAALRGDDSAGLAATLFLFAVVWTTDIAAYFVGRALGGPKLAPSISPGKTWSGALGGAAGAIILGLAVAILLGATVHWLSLLVMILALSAVSQVGDLFESSIKRRCGVKDSSQLIPGHGGVMDRVDGLVVAAIALFLLGAITVSPEFPAHFLFAR